jgi:hypothetical protein
VAFNIFCVHGNLGLYLAGDNALDVPRIILPSALTHSPGSPRRLAAPVRYANSLSQFHILNIRHKNLCCTFYTYHLSISHRPPTLPPPWWPNHSQGTHTSVKSSKSAIAPTQFPVPAPSTLILAIILALPSKHQP